MSTFVCVKRTSYLTIHLLIVTDIVEATQLKQFVLFLEGETNDEVDNSIELDVLLSNRGNLGS